MSELKIKTTAGLWAAALGLGFAATGCDLLPDRPVNQPKLMSTEVEPLPAPDPSAPLIERMEVKATRGNRDTRTTYSIHLAGTLPRPADLDSAFGPTGWSVTELVDAQGKPMRFATAGEQNADSLATAPVAELYRRIGVSMGRTTGDRLAFSVQVRDLDYLTPRLKRLGIRSFALVADGEQWVEIDPPPSGEGVELEGGWTLSVQDTMSDEQELLLQAADANPALWPLEIEMVDENGQLLAVGFRRGIETLGEALATRWTFNQPAVWADDGRTLRVRLAEGLRIQQLDTELGDVRLIELKQPPPPAK